MTPDERRSLFATLRGAPLHGRFVDLVPYGPEHAEAVVRLRNAERARYFLNQQEPATVEGQHAWYRGYLARDDDAYWVLHTRDGRAVGILALYDVAWDGSNSQLGRHVTDETAAFEAPYTLDGQLTVLKFAIERLQLRRVEAVIRPDNAKVVSMNTRVGFRYEGPRDLRGVEYGVHVLTPETFHPAPLEAILDHWLKRGAAAGRLRAGTRTGPGAGD